MPRVWLLRWLKLELLERPAASLQTLQCKIQDPDVVDHGVDVDVVDQGVVSMQSKIQDILVVWVLLIIEGLIGFVLNYSLFQGSLR